MIARRRFIQFLAPAIIVAPNLMKLSRKSSSLVRKPLLVPYRGIVRADAAAYYAPYIPKELLAEQMAFAEVTTHFRTNFPRIVIEHDKEDYRNFL